MSLKAEVVLEWADGEYLFALKGAQIEELQSICGDVGFGTIYQRTVLGNWRWGDIYHSIRLGLIGGGMGAVEAKRLTDAYIGREAPPETRLPLIGGPNNPESVARAVMGAAMFGVAKAAEEAPPSGEARAGESPAFGTSPSGEPRSPEMG